MNKYSPRKGKNHSCFTLIQQICMDPLNCVKYSADGGYSIPGHGYYKNRNECNVFLL